MNIYNTVPWWSNRICAPVDAPLWCVSSNSPCPMTSGYPSTHRQIAQLQGHPFVNPEKKHLLITQFSPKIKKIYIYEGFELETRFHRPCPTPTHLEDFLDAVPLVKFVFIFEQFFYHILHTGRKFPDKHLKNILKN